MSATADATAVYLWDASHGQEALVTLLVAARDEARDLVVTAVDVVAEAGPTAISIVYGPTRVRAVGLGMVALGSGAVLGLAAITRVTALEAQEGP